MLKQVGFVIAAYAIARFVLVPSMWWCIIDEVTRSNHARLDLVALIACPHIFAIFWAAEAMSFYGSGLQGLLVQGRVCFCWAHACKMPRLLGTQKWWNDLKRRNVSNNYVIVSVVILGHVHILAAALTFRGAIGLMCWSLSLQRPRQRQAKAKAKAKKHLNPTLQSTTICDS